MNIKNLLVTFCLLLWAAVRVGVAGPADTYVPLRVGNTWTYVGDDQSTRKFTIVGTREIHGNAYYHFDDYYTPCCYPGYSESTDALLRYDPDLQKLLQYDSFSGEELVRYDFSGNVWGACGNQLMGAAASAFGVRRRRKPRPRAR